MKRSLASAFGFVALAKLLITATDAVITPILTRLLGATLYGQLGTILAIFTLLQITVTSGVTSGVKKFISEDRSADGWQSRVWSFYLLFGTALSLLFASGLVLAVQSGLVSDHLGQDYVPYFYLLAVMTFAIQYQDLVRHTLMGLQLERYSEPLRMAQRLVYAVLAVGLVSLGFGVSGVLIGKIAGGLLLFTVGLYLVKRRLDPSLAVVRDREFPSRDLVSFSNRSIVYVFLLTSLLHVDVLVLQWYTGDTTVGYYRAAIVMVHLLLVIPKSAEDVMIQSVSDYWRSDQVSKISSLAADTTRYVTLFTVLCSIGLFALADVFVPLYFGSEYAAAVTPLVILLPGVVGFAATRPVLTITQAKGNLRPLIAATGTAAVLNVGLNLMLIPSYGMTGAAVATTIGYGSMPFVQAMAARSIGYEPFDVPDHLRIAATALLAGPVILALGYVLDGPVALAVVPPLGGVVFLGAAIGTGAIKSDEVQGARQWIDGRWVNT